MHIEVNENMNRKTLSLKEVHINHKNEINGYMFKLTNEPNTIYKYMPKTDEAFVSDAQLTVLNLNTLDISYIHISSIVYMVNIKKIKIDIEY